MPEAATAVAATFVAVAEPDDGSRGDVGKCISSCFEPVPVGLARGSSDNNPQVSHSSSAQLSKRSEWA